MLAVMTVSAGGQQPAASNHPLSPAELQAILEHQPDFTADAIVADPHGSREVRTGRVARRDDLYRFDPNEAILRHGEHTPFELVGPGTYCVMRLKPSFERVTALLVQPKERRYYEINLELQQAYVRHLTAALAACEASRPEGPQAGRAWQLYQRLRQKPWLRRLWRWCRRVSRP